MWNVSRRVIKEEIKTMILAIEIIFGAVIFFLFITEFVKLGDELMNEENEEEK